MSLANVRKIFERKLAAAFEDESVPVVFDNVQEEPPTGPEAFYAIINITFPNVTTPVICREEPMLTKVNGSIQISLYGPRLTGMKRLEQLAEVAIKVLCKIGASDDPDDVRPYCGEIAGPVSVLSGNGPMALTVVSAPFTARA